MQTIKQRKLKKAKKNDKKNYLQKIWTKNADYCLNME